VWHDNAASHADITSGMDIGSHETSMSEQPVVQRKLASLWQWCGRGGEALLGRSVREITAIFPVIGRDLELQ
jgi:hypothetical protein